MDDHSGFEQDHQSHNNHNYEDPNNYDQTLQQQQQQQYENQQQMPPQQQPAGPTQFTSQSAQLNFTFQPNQQHPPPPYRPAAQYHQPAPVYVNPAHRPGPHQPPPHYSPAHNAGPQKATTGGGNYYQPPPGSPMKYNSYDQNSGPGASGYGPPGPGYTGPARVQVGGSPAPGIPVQHPHPGPGPQVQTKAWSSGLFDCMNDPSNALITAFCPCITFGQVAEIIDNGHSTCATSGLIYGLAYALAVPCLVSYTYRTKLRRMFGLTETPAPDLATHLLCEWCAICQAYRQLRDSGYDPAIGWEGNAAKRNLEALQRNQIQMTPPINERMMA